ncbi:MAG TPA: hypothetical protein VL400_17525 [Polyangiaceae bacterium]|nr:hypothetical protein [Polyangiaceae bacterium]
MLVVDVDAAVSIAPSATALVPIAAAEAPTPSAVSVRSTLLRGGASSSADSRSSRSRSLPG